MRRAIAGAALLLMLASSPAMAQPEGPGAGQPSSPPCQGEYRSNEAQEGGAERGQFIADRARESDYGVGDEVTTNQSEGTYPTC
jgi:hypothetical protein